MRINRFGMLAWLCMPLKLIAWIRELAISFLLLKSMMHWIIR